MEIRTLGPVSYLKLNGGKWMKVDTGKLRSDGASSFGATSDPTQYLDFLNGVSDKVTNAGHETVRGIDTTHYMATIDLQRALDREGVDPSVHKELQAAFDQLGVDLPLIPADVWIDAEGRMRKLTMVLDFGSVLGAAGRVPGAGGESPLMTMTVELHDFGAPVHVQAPSADEIAPYDTNAIHALAGG
jgi:hypothetical protein